VFEWDEAKSQDNLEKRGFDFEYAARIFTWRGGSRRTISARLASRRERDAYRQTFGKSNR
jgi:uncharacterized DUF497 family protein